MGATTPAMLNFLLHSVPLRKRIDNEGHQVSEPDPRYLMYRFLDVDVDNLVAFVKESQACEDLVQSYRGHLPSRLWRELANDIHAEVESGIISVTAAAGQHAHFLQLLLRDVTESYHYLSQGGTGKRGGLADKLRGAQGDGQGGQGGQPQAGGGGGQGGGGPPGRG